MSTCTSCGTEARAKFCPECGTGMPAEITPPAASDEQAAVVASSGSVATVPISAPTTTRSAKWRWLATAGVLVLLAAAAATWFAFHGGADQVAPVTKTHTVSGTLTVSGQWGEDGSCGSSASDIAILEGVIDGKTYPCPGGPGGGYDDIEDGAQVTIKDGSGKLLAVGNLTGGTVAMDGVSFKFEVPKVKETAFYQVEVAHRGGVNYPIADMESKDWTVSLNLG